MKEEPDALTNRIEALVSAADQRLQNLRRQTAEEAEQQQKRFLLFNDVAASLLRDEIAVRVNSLAKYFPNAQVECVEAIGTYGAICRFQHTPRFPATVEMRLTCAHDDHVEQFIFDYNLELLPIFIKYDKHDQIVTPLDPLNRSRVCTWLDEVIVKFLETYLQLEFVDQYQRENQVTDPVSQARVNRIFAVASASYKGHAYYFVSDRNRELFEAAPQRYVGP